MKNLILAVLAVSCFTGCLNRNKPSTSDLPATEDQVLQQDVTDVDGTEYFGDGHTAQNALDYEGTYKGTLPCADCEGIDTTLTLEEDGTYVLATRYIGGKSTSETYRDTGKYRWDDDGTRIILLREGEPSLRFFVGENYLYHLDLEGNRIEGPNAEYYRLEKQ